MKRSITLTFSLLVAIAMLAIDRASTVAPAAATYAKDVAPIIQKNCMTCHRPGEIAPMSLTNYKETRPWAKAIREVVATRKMPPWFADPKFGDFSNDCRLSDQEIQTIAAWVDGGAKEGDPRTFRQLLNSRRAGPLANRMLYFRCWRSSKSLLPVSYRTNFLSCPRISPKTNMCSSPRSDRVTGRMYIT